jgi:hypothetical protein
MDSEERKSDMAEVVAERSVSAHAPTLSATLVALIEKKTGESIEQLQASPIAHRRIKVEASGLKTCFVRYFPFIGRGSVMGDYLLTRDQVAEEFEKAVR